MERRASEKVKGLQIETKQKLVRKSKLTKRVPYG